jgi:hypothetical protein
MANAVRLLELRIHVVAEQEQQCGVESQVSPTLARQNLIRQENYLRYGKNDSHDSEGFLIEREGPFPGLGTGYPFTTCNQLNLLKDTVGLSSRTGDQPIFSPSRRTIPCCVWVPLLPGGSLGEAPQISEEKSAH